MDGWPAGHIKNFKTDTWRRWKAEADSEVMAPAEAAEAARKASVKLAQRRAQKLAEDMAVAMKARAMIAAASPALPRHPYIIRKGIRPDGLLQDRIGRLLIPMRNAAEEVWNVQTISGNGDKFYLAGRKSGLWHMLGQPVDGKPLALVEGVATGASAHEITGWPVAIAFDGGNLLPVARELRAMFPASPVWLLDDDDRHLPLRSPPLPNIGREKATAAAEAVGGRLAFPLFREGDGGTDFNDAHQRLGARAVLRQILASIGAAAAELQNEQSVYVNDPSP